MTLRVGIAGASGYTGVELIRLLVAHPQVEVVALSGGRAAGQPVAKSWPALAGLGLPDLQPLSLELCAGLDVLFLALPHGVSAGFVGELVAAGQLARGLRVIDLGADFRLRDPAVHAAAYGAHPHPELLAQAVYGLPERFRDQIRGAALIANPGCYPTATAIAALPLVDALGADWVVADCLSGVSGAGRSPGPRNLYCETTERAVAYGVAGSHRHTPEIEQLLGVPVTFTPHLAPMSRGMLATVHARVRRLPSAAELRALYDAAYADHPMVVVVDSPPSSGDVRGTARAHVAAFVDPARGVVTATCAIDNLGKGAAGQAVHNMNLACGLPETAGLPLVPLLP
ncbi:MAG: N-acetyl-gamma-glutamyl-phosphate reductase [Deltaproteobacteria bacterium]|jgi:N-acetyl-gamma-glutamyl-phosphate reductase|nr:N-acetyl-gamma-glutamyl-phosphate reductase [Deltaproteobacteria bacterium]